MSELTGLALRKAACEALGWKKETMECGGGFTFHRPSCSCRSVVDCGCTFEQCDHDVEIDCIHGCGTDGPAIESDPAVSEPMFLEWCEKHRFTWELWSLFDGDRVYFRILMHGTGEFISGASMSECRARAIVEASK